MVQSAGVTGVTSYRVNALGQRIRKTNLSLDRSTCTTRAAADRGDQPRGIPLREYLYLNDIPLAVIQ